MSKESQSSGLKEIVEEALQQPPAERAPWLRQRLEGSTERLALALGLLRDREIDLLAPEPAAPTAPRKITLKSSEALLKEIASVPRFESRRFEGAGLLGGGGMGDVWEVEDKFLGRPLAVKTLRGAVPQEEGASIAHDRRLSRFLAEAQITSQLDHPGVVPVHDVGVDEKGRICFRMRRVLGVNASEVFSKARAEIDGWTRARAIEVILKACDTVAFAHEKGVLHRDLKPDNLRVGSFGEVYVMDWGLAKVMGEVDHHDLTVRVEPGEGVLDADGRNAAGGSRVTVDGVVPGTIHYMSPEQALSEPLDHRTDIYALGATLYELLTGQPPYSEGCDSNVEVLDLVRAGPPRRVEELAPHVEPALNAIVEKAMKRKPQDRYPSVGALAEDLRSFLDLRVVRAYPVGALAELKLWMRRNRALAVSLVAAAVILILGSIGVLYYAREASDHAWESHLRGLAAAARANELDIVSRFQQARLSEIDVEAMSSGIRDSMLDSCSAEAKVALAELLSSVRVHEAAIAGLRRSVLQPALEAIDRDFGSLPRVQLRLLLALQESLEKLASVQTIGRELIPLHRMVIDGWSKVLRNPEVVGSPPAWLSAKCSLADALTGYSRVCPPEELAAVFGQAELACSEALELSKEGVNASLRSRLHSEMQALLLERFKKGLSGSAEDVLLQAREHARLALQSLDPERDRLRWAHAQEGLGKVLQTIGENISDDLAFEYFDLAAEAYRKAAQVFEGGNWTIQSASAQINYGTLLRIQAERTRGETGARLLLEAQSVLEEVISGLDCVRQPRYCSMAHKAVGDVLCALVKQRPETRVERLRAAVQHYLEAKRGYSRESNPQDWANAASALGVAQLDLEVFVAKDEKRALLLECMAHFSDALEVRGRVFMPQDWAFTREMLAVAQGRMASQSVGEERDRFFREAISGCIECLKEMGPELDREGWGRLNFNLASLYLRAANRKDLGAFRRDARAAVCAYLESLRAFTRDGSPMEWAAVQADMSRAMAELGESIGGAVGILNLLGALARLDAVREIRTRESMPRQWSIDMKTRSHAQNRAREMWVELCLNFWRGCCR